MTNEKPNQPASDKELFVKMAIDGWNGQSNRFNQLLDKLTDEQLAAETSPGRNSGLYLLGHLAGVSDALLPLLGFGEKIHPELEHVFLRSPDKSGIEKPAASELRKYWKEISAKLDDHIKNTPANEWFNRHTSVSEADFANEPHRNKLNVLLGRTSHLSYHTGQMAYLQQK